MAAAYWKVFFVVHIGLASIASNSRDSRVGVHIIRLGLVDATNLECDEVGNRVERRPRMPYAVACGCVPCYRPPSKVSLVLTKVSSLLGEPSISTSLTKATCCMCVRMHVSARVGCGHVWLCACRCLFCLML
jgi:biotin synthase-related radical SAM superfamily protein